MTNIEVTFLIILHLIAQAYATGVLQSAATTGTKLAQLAATTGTKLKYKHNSYQQIQSNTGPKPISIKWFANPFAAKPPTALSATAPAMPNHLSKIEQQFYKAHASVLTPGVSINDFEVQRHLSTGDDGSVYMVQRNKDNAKFAMKKMELTPETNFRELAEQIDIQVQATKDKRTHINNVFAVFLDQNKICMILELMKGNVNGYIINRGTKLTEKQFCVMTKGMMEDLAYLEERGISHRDLDTCNLFVNDKNEIVIGDFQRATKQREFSCTYHAWPSYAPPEWSKQPTLTNLFRKCTIKVDVWAIGVFFKKIKSQISDASDTFAEMLTPNALFNAEPARRPSFSEMLSSPLFQQC